MTIASKIMVGVPSSQNKQDKAFVRSGVVDVVLEKA